MGSGAAASHFLLFGVMTVIRLEHITKTFGGGGQEIHAVRDVSLDIADGEIFGIIGYSGAGNWELTTGLPGGKITKNPVFGKEARRAWHTVMV